MQVAATLTTNRATADYINYHLRSGAVSLVDVAPRSESKDSKRGFPFGERASSDDDNRMIYDSEQVTRCRRNACSFNVGTSDDRDIDRRGEESMNNYDVCTAIRLGRYE